MSSELSALFRELDPKVRKILTFDDSGNIILYKRKRGRWGFWIIEGDMPKRLSTSRHPSQLAKDRANTGLVYTPKP